MNEGQVAVIFSPNSIWYPVAAFGVSRLGGVISGASPSYNAEEMATVLQVAGARVLFTAPSSIKIASKSAEKAGIPKENIILLEGQIKGYRSIFDLIQFATSFDHDEQIAPFKIPKNQTNRDICGFLGFTSGTTGIPKAVCSSLFYSLIQV